MSVVIEVASAVDADNLAALHYLSHTTSFAAFATPEWVNSRRLEDYLQQWHEFFRKNDARARAWKALSIDNELVGMVKVSPMDEREAQLASMHVHPSHQRRGIGRMLMDEAVQFIRDSGFETAILGVIQANTGARALYESSGWTVDELRPMGYEGVPIATCRKNFSADR